MIYIDLNMVRAGVVGHPKDWPHCGYNEIVSHRQRYKIIDKARLVELLNLKTQDELKAVYESSIATAIELKYLKRESMWTESIAVGSQAFVEQVSKRLGYKARGRKLIDHKGTFELREDGCSYGCDFPFKMALLRHK
jgi:putative transposase